jgi:xanthine dehydrogenase YagR molybdenum-binding subunit
MDRAAEALSLDPLEFRRKNQVRPQGQPGRRTTPPGQIIDTQPLEGGVPFSSNGLDQCLRLGAQAFGWQQPLGLPADPAKKRGRGMSMMIYRGGPGATSAAEVRLDRTGRVSLVCGLMDVGEGATTVLAQMAGQVLGVDSRDIRLFFPTPPPRPTPPSPPVPPPPSPPARRWCRPRHRCDNSSWSWPPMVWRRRWRSWSWRMAPFV